MNTWKNILILTGLVLFFSQMAYTQDMPVGQTLIEDIPQKNQAQTLESLVSTNRNVRLDVAVKLDKQRSQLVQKLMVIIDGTNSVKVKLDAVVVLGQYRASEAVPLLVRHLEWDDAGSHGEPMRPTMTEEDWAEITPVTFALEKIGIPAIPELLDKIAQTDDTNITTKCVSIFQAIEGKEVTQFRLQGLLDKETDPKKKERIQAALDALKKLNPVK